MSWKHLHPTWKLCWVISDRLIYLFDGVPNSTSHESKTPSNSSFFYQFYPPTASHHPTTKTSHPPKDNFAPKQNHANLFLLAVFFFASLGSACWGVLKRWCHSPVSTQKPGRWISPSTRCEWKKWTPTNLLQQKMVVFFLDGDFHPIKSQSINKKSPTQNKHIQVKRFFGRGSSKQNTPYQTHGSGEWGPAKWGNGKHTETKFPQPKNLEDRSPIGSPPHTFCRCLPRSCLKNTVTNPRNCKQVVIANHYWRPNPQSVQGSTGRLEVGIRSWNTCNLWSFGVENKLQKNHILQNDSEWNTILFLNGFEGAWPNLIRRRLCQSDDEDDKET